ncbi:MAG: MarR family winged helix-turn-helix transcriptional regulator [Galbitalea sp.]
MTPRALQSEFADADESTGLMLWRVTNAWQAAPAPRPQTVRAHPCAVRATRSLTWIESDAPVTQQSLAGHAGTDPMMTSQVLRTLEAAALIERMPHPHDRRARVLTATPAGRDLANRANGAVESCDHDFFDTLGADRTRFTRMLARLG